MKKFIVATAALFLLTGCGNKLTCTKTDDSDGVKSYNKMTFTYNDNKIKNVAMRMEIGIPEEYKDIAGVLESSFKAEFSPFEEYGATLKTEIKDDKMIGTLEYDATNLKEEELKSMEKNFLYISGNKAKAREALESNGYKCK